MDTFLTQSQQKAIEYSEPIKNICNPLFSYLEITAFSSARLFKNGNLTYLSSDPNWLKFYFHNNYHTINTFQANPEFLNSPFVLWYTVANNPVVIGSEKYFGFSNGISLIIPRPGYYQICNFSSNKNNFGINNWYIAHIDLLEHFAAYFDVVAEKLYKNIFPLSHNVPSTVITALDKKTTLIDNSLKKFIDTTALTVYKLTVNKKVVLFKKRELEIICYFLQGYTAKEISSKLFVSPRTVESHFVNIKEKLNCHSKSNMFNKLLHTPLFEELLIKYLSD